MKEKKFWFKAKKYGWGWYPASREGWFVVGWYIVALVTIFTKINQEAQAENNIPVETIVSSAIITAILIFICYKTGEKPEWRWGEKKDH